MKFIYLISFLIGCWCAWQFYKRKACTETAKGRITSVWDTVRHGKYVGYVHCVQGKTFFGSKNLNGELFPVHYHPKYPKIHWPELSDAMPGYRIW